MSVDLLAYIKSIEVDDSGSLNLDLGDLQSYIEKNFRSVDDINNALGEDVEKRHVRVRKNTHGSCCQCQTCGEDHDDCIMMKSLDEDELRAKVREALKLNRV